MKTIISSSDYTTNNQTIGYNKYTAGTSVTPTNAIQNYVSITLDQIGVFIINWEIIITCTTNGLTNRSVWYDFYLSEQSAVQSTIAYTPNCRLHLSNDSKYTFENIDSPNQLFLPNTIIYQNNSSSKTLYVNGKFYTNNSNINYFIINVNMQQVRLT